ncbi:MAG: hypothetical protein AAGA18_00475 [Verrucomicrobiota bacterium]
MTLLHFLAKMGELEHISPEYLTEELLRLGDKDGNTTMHYAASEGCLCDLPQDALCDGLLFINNNLGVTPMHLAMQNGIPEQIPIKFFTLDNLSRVDNYGRTIASMNSSFCLSFLPDHLVAELSERKIVSVELTCPEP